MYYYYYCIANIILHILALEKLTVVSDNLQQ
jgi:hypothetical protein